MLCYTIYIVSNLYIRTVDRNFYIFANRMQLTDHLLIRESLLVWQSGGKP